MKKMSIIAMALLLVAAIAAPVMATDVSFSGTYRVRGFIEGDYDLSDGSDNATSAYLDMRLRHTTKFKVNDNLSLTTRFDALDGKPWGNNYPDDGATLKHNIDFDRAYMTIKTSFGMFSLGRMSGGTWGLSWADSGQERDRIKYVLPMDNMTFLFIYEKREENDGFSTSLSDADYDWYHPAVLYKTENMTLGVLGGFGSKKSSGNPNTTLYLVYPYFTAKFGNLSLEGEFNWIGGTVDYDSGTDYDISKFAGMIAASMNLGPANVGLGYAYMSGDNDSSDDKLENFGGTGADWEKVWILTNSTMGSSGSLGSNVTTSGNLQDSGSTAADAGLNMIWAEASFSPMENVNLGFLYAYAMAADEPTSYDDFYGHEIDVTLKVKMFDNLSYTAVAAYLIAGDFWKGTGTTDVDNFYSFYNALQLSY